MKEITLVEVEGIAFRLAHALFGAGEPIPDFGTRFPGRLESCLAVPFFSFARRPLYRGILAKAAILFYVMIKNHPFQNGNKRLAITTLLVFFSKNNKWLQVDNRQLYNFCKMVAQSDAVIKDEMVLAIEKLLKTYIVSLN